MAHLLIYEESLRRLQGELSAFRGLEIVVMNERGELHGHGDPEVAWLSTEAFRGPACQAFLAAMLASPRLKWVQSCSAGIDHLPAFGALLDRGVRLSTSHAQAEGIAEYVLAGVLDHFQATSARRAAQRSKRWDPVSFREISGTTWLLVGFGAIGQAIAARTRAFGASIIGVRRDVTPHPLADHLVSLDALADVLPRADVVVACLPLTRATHELFDARAFRAMKRRAVFVNVCRGALVREPDLLAALDAGTPEHAILDVFATEPLPSDSAFWHHPRVALTPHASALSDGLQSRNDALFLENLRRLLSTGGPLLNEVTRSSR